jgi:hypothetical protein
MSRREHLLQIAACFHYDDLSLIVEERGITKRREFYENL